MARLIITIIPGTSHIEDLVLEYQAPGKRAWVPLSLAGLTRVTLRLVDAKGSVVGTIDSDETGFGSGQPIDQHSGGPGVLRLSLGPYAASLTGADEIPAGRYEGRLLLYGVFDGVSYPDGLPWTTDALVVVEP